MHDQSSSNPRQSWKLVDKAKHLTDYFVSMSTVDDSNALLPEFNQERNSVISHLTF